MRRFASSPRENRTAAEHIKLRDILEESPSPALDPETRRKMGELSTRFMEKFTM